MTWDIYLYIIRVAYLSPTEKLNAISLIKIKVKKDNK